MLLEGSMKIPFVTRVAYQRILFNQTFVGQCPWHAHLCQDKR
jgi:hypothetical protein